MLHDYTGFMDIYYLQKRIEMKKTKKDHDFFKRACMDVDCAGLPGLQLLATDGTRQRHAIGPADA